MRERARATGTEDEEIQKTYIVEYEGEYFAGWEGTDWATVPRIALWTKDRRKASQIKIDTVIDRQELMHLVTGFSNTKLIPVNMEDRVTITPIRKPKIWKTSKQY